MHIACKRTVANPFIENGCDILHFLSRIKVIEYSFRQKSKCFGNPLDFLPGACFFTVIDAAAKKIGNIRPIYRQGFDNNMTFQSFSHLLLKSMNKLRNGLFQKISMDDIGNPVRNTQ